MSEKKKQIFAAIFLIGGIVIFLLAITWIRGVTIKRMNVLYIKLKDAGGLRHNDPVDIGGVQKGKVSKMELKENYVLVKLLIDPHVKIPRDSRITMRNFSLMTGEKYIKIALGNSKEYLRSGDTVWAYYYDDFSISNLSHSLKKIDSLLSALNPEEINTLVKTGLKNVIYKAEKSVEFTASEKKNISGMIETLNRISMRLDTLTMRIEQGQGSLGKLLNDSSLYNEIRTTNNELRELIKDIRENPTRYFNIKLF